MALSESILVAIFCMAVVFSVLGILWAIVRLFSWFINIVENRNIKSSSDN